MSASSEAAAPLRHILLVEDEAYVRDSLTEVLEERGFRVSAEASGDAALRLLGRTRFDLILTDLRMAGMDGLELVRRVRSDGGDVPIVVLTGHGTVSSAVDCVRAGASDYLLKPADPDRLVASIGQAIGDAAAGGETPVGRSPGWTRALAMADAAAPADSTVLLLGESGTGKEVLARRIHLGGPRRAAPFVRVNCAAVPLDMWESEFFGHRRGAFTGAASDRDGRFVVADGGTLFLDEIGATPLSVQPKLLRVLQDGVVERIGETRPRQVDVRIVAATNSDLEAEVEAGRFRADLFHRLDVIRIEVPPLRERPEDVAPLVEHFVAQIASKLSRPVPEISADVVAELSSRPWPGNVRELRNLVERSMVLGPADGFTLVSSSSEAPPSGSLKLRSALKRHERSIVREALRRSGGVRKTAAELLGIDQRNLGYYLKKHDLDRPTTSDPPSEEEAWRRTEFDVRVD